MKSHFQEKCSSCYILSNDQVLLPDYLFFLKYWSICVLKLFIGYLTQKTSFGMRGCNFHFFFRNAHAQMRRFSCKQTSCWRQLLQSWCFQGAYTFVEKYDKAKVNNQHLLLNSAYVVVLIMMSNLLLYSNNYSLVKSHFLSVYQNQNHHHFCSSSQRIKKNFLLLQFQPVNIAHAYQVLPEIPSSCL